MVSGALSGSARLVYALDHLLNNYFLSLPFRVYSLSHHFGYILIFGMPRHIQFKASRNAGYFQGRLVPCRLLPVFQYYTQKNGGAAQQSNLFKTNFLKLQSNSYLPQSTFASKWQLHNWQYVDLYPSPYFVQSRAIVTCN